MKRLKFNLQAQNNQQELANAFNQYFLKPNSANALAICINLLQNEMYANGVKEICFDVDKIPQDGSHKTGLITISAKVLKQAKNIQTLPKIVGLITHELNHELIDMQNARIIKTKTIKSKYLPEYLDSYTYNLLFKIFDDIEVATYAQMYYYSKSEYELEARKYEYINTIKILKEFAPQLLKNMPSFEEKEASLKKSWLSTKGLIQYIYMFDSSINKFQTILINKGLNNFDEQDFNDLYVSAIMCLKPETKNLLVNQMCSCNNIEVIKKLFKTPIYNFSKEDIQKLKQTYGTKQMQELTFKQADKQAEHVLNS